MSDIGSISNLAGANPALARAAPGARSTPPEPATVQQAVAQPLTAPQSAVTQSPITAAIIVMEIEVASSPVGNPPTERTSGPRAVTAVTAPTPPMSSAVGKSSKRMA